MSADVGRYRQRRPDTGRLSAENFLFDTGKDNGKDTGKDTRKDMHKGTC